MAPAKKGQNMQQPQVDLSSFSKESKQKQDFWLKTLEGTVHYNSAILKEGWANSIAKFFMRLFKKMHFEVHPEAVNAAKNGSIVYALTDPSRLEFLFLHLRAKEKGLVPPTFGHYFSLVVFQPIWVLLRRIIAVIYSLIKFKRYPNPYKDGYVKDQLEQGCASCIFLSEFKGLPRRFGFKKRDPLAELFELRPKTKPIYVVPVFFAYERLISREKRKILDIFFGPKEHPGRLRRLAMLLRYHRRALVRVLEPIDLEKFMESNTQKVAYTTNRQNELAYLLRRECLDRVYRAQRSVLGPQLKSRAEIIEMLVHDPEITELVVKMAGSDPIKVDELLYKVREYADEIAADYNSAFLNFLDIVLTILWKRIFSEIEVGKEEIANIQMIAERYPIVYVPCHKSHLDYLLMSYVLFYHHLNPPHIAAGVNLSFWPLGPIFRRCGAFFMRRSFKGMELYNAVFAKYVELLLKEQVNVEFFIEGGRSRTGKMLIPKLGYLSIMLDRMRKANVEDIAFVPVSIAYEQLFEERTYIKEQSGKDQKLPYIPKGIFKNKSRVCIDFAEPFLAKDYLKKLGITLTDRREQIMAAANYIAHKVVWEINRIQRVTPTALCAYVLLSTTKRGILYSEITRRSFKLVELLESKGAPFASNIDKQALWLDAALKKFVDSKAIRFIKEVEGESVDSAESLCIIFEDKRMKLALYKNSIVHWFQDEALALIAHNCYKKLELDETKMFIWLRELLRSEFIFAPRPSETSEEMLKKQKLALEFLEGANAFDESRAKELVVSAILPSIEAYYIVLKTVIGMANRAFSERELIRIALKRAESMYQLEQTKRPEAINRVIFSTALSAFARIGLLKDKLVMIAEGKTERIYDKQNPELLAEALSKLEAVLNSCN